ncbi:hypothetical protein HMPREF1863_00573 [Aedoeadaptatus coxii]|uniref:Uncharacterized protein n=1 Tax=Aedoeadaptatus coxii TaxID=755172 RepID=A0A134AI23_9FIRM|nr:hypothetical protein HMPREF1863_00573 [Peptoniphilus coxii]
MGNVCYRYCTTKRGLDFDSHLLFELPGFRPLKKPADAGLFNRNVSLF